MNWIGTWCAERCTLGKNCDECSEICAPRFAIARAANCSEHLVWMLMFQSNCVTSPHIADAIADYIGATVEQRDSIVHPKHHGTWTPTVKPFKTNGRRRGGKTEARAVVAVDRYGFVVRRFSSMQEAAKYAGCSGPTISARCSKTPIDKDEFLPHGITFRFESEWDNFTQEEWLENIRERKSAFASSQKGGTP